LKILPFAFSKRMLLVIFIGSYFVYGCNSSSKTSLQDTQPNQSPPSPTKGTRIYRYLSAMYDAHPDKNSLIGLCIRQHGFKLELPKESIRSAHDIHLPAEEEWSETRQVERQYNRNVVIQPPSVNGIVMHPITKTVPHQVTENIEEIKRISGTCIGTEYILN